MVCQQGPWDIFHSLLLHWKKRQAGICCTKDFLGRDIGEPSIPLIFKVLPMYFDFLLEKCNYIPTKQERKKIVCDFCPVFSEKKFCLIRYPLGYRLVIKELILYFPFFMHFILRKPLKILVSYILRPDENSLHFCPCKHRISLLQV